MIGNAVGYISSGLILSMFPGWEPIYYLCGVLGLVWSVGWYTMCYSSPAEHPFITEEERNYIESQLALNTKEVKFNFFYLVTVVLVLFLK